MSQLEDIENYCNSIRRIKSECLDSGLSESDFQRLYYESLKSLKINNKPLYANQRTHRISKVLLIGIVLALYCFYNSKVIYNSLVCNIQDYVYPGLRLLRRLSIPAICIFPSLTDYYHESCLIQNPFFTVVDMDCWPCSTVANVRQITMSKPTHQQHSAPFIYMTNQKAVSTDDLKYLYIKHKKSFEKESFKVSVNNKFYTNLEDMFFKNTETVTGNRFIWRINSMNAARLLRQIIKRPKIVPKFGQSTERFILIDSRQEPFSVPDTECNFSFLLSLNGNRMVQLTPAEECKHQCKVIEVELKESHLLWYNWWYWRPIVQRAADNSTFVGFLSSYC